MAIVLKVDLHIHSHYSCDGDFSPQDLVEMALENGVGVIALTDHNTINGIPEFLKAGEGTQLKIAPGVEIDGTYLNLIFHILGYYFDWRSPYLTGLLQKTVTAQVQLIKDSVNSLAQQGFAVTYEDVLRFTNEQSIPGFATIAKAAFNGNPSYEGQYFDFMQQYLASGFTDTFKEALPTVETVIRLITELGGVPVLAHPGSYLDPCKEEEQQILKDFSEMGLRGIETFSTYHDTDLNKGFLKVALELDLLVTAGSDFHGELKPKFKVGGVPETRFPIYDTLATNGFFRAW